MFTNHIYLIYKLDLALNSLQWLKCHKTKPKQTNSVIAYFILFLDNALPTTITSITTIIIIFCFLFIFKIFFFVCVCVCVFKWVSKVL